MQTAADWLFNSVIFLGIRLLPFSTAVFSPSRQTPHTSSHQVSKSMSYTAMASDEMQDDMQIDPAIAAAMGFSGFGMQTGKKRKHGGEDAYAYVDTQPQQASTEMIAGQGPPGGNQSTGAGQQQPRQAPGESEATATQTAVDADGKPTLHALRHGVRNAHGDMGYFLPSFIEDPWKDLQPK